MSSVEAWLMYRSFIVSTGLHSCHPGIHWAQYKLYCR